MDNTDGTKKGEVLNKHSILEGSIKLYRELQRKKKSHRSVLDNQLYDVRMIEAECPIDVDKDSKEHLIRRVVGKMVVR